MYRALTILISLAAFVLLVPGNVPEPAVPRATDGYIGPVIETESFLFVGDVMLARYVETLIQEKSLDYLFADTAALFEKYDFVIGNFEGPVTKVHVPTKKDELTFSIASSTVSGLGQYFDFLSLANNHTFDYGADGLAFTEKTLASEGVTTFGHPRVPQAGQPAVVDHDAYRVVIHGLHAVDSFTATSSLAMLRDYEAPATFQVVYVHWGEEYIGVHNDTQEEIATALVTAGADVIIGHHPHVVQDVGLIDGVPVFYSLGNFIFDQYFATSTQQHLAVALEVENRNIHFRLIPLTSFESDSVPQLMPLLERDQFLLELAARSDERLYEQILAGHINLGAVLASL